MKRITLLILAATLFTQCGKKETLTITGSETMHLMADYLGKEFEKDNKDIRVEVFGGGSLEGIQKLLKNETDIALASRDLSEDEQRSLNKLGDLEKLTIAYDGVAIVVHPTNLVTKLHLEQISDIFSGKAKSWTEVGGTGDAILVLARNDKSGTLAYFREHILKQKDLGSKAYEANKGNDFPKNVKIVADNSEMANLISNNKNAIGFMGMGSALIDNREKIKTVAYAQKATDDYVLPTIENVYNRKYRLSRALYMLYKAETHARIERFSSFLTSDKGQNLILKSGYLRASLPEVEVKAQ